MCVKAAYEAGAGYVKINWHDEQDNLMNYPVCKYRDVRGDSSVEVRYGQTGSIKKDAVIFM